MQEEEEAEKGNFSCSSAIALVFFTYNAAAAAYRSADDPWALSFVIFAYANLICLYWCLRRFEMSAESSRPRLKAAIWLLATVLTTMFAYRVAAMMPWPVAALVWAVASATSLGGFYAFFLHTDRQPIEAEFRGGCFDKTKE